MKKIIAFGASIGKASINKQLASYVGELMEGVDYEVLDLNDFPLPIFSVDLEAEMGGQPANAHLFFKKLQEADGIVISLAEHNGAYSAGFKNLMDWVSRIKGEFFEGKPVFLMATAPGPRGGKSVLNIAENRFPFHAADITGTFSMPMFYDNFVDGDIVNEDLKMELNRYLDIFQAAVVTEAQLV